MAKNSILDDAKRGRCPGCLSGVFWECWSFAGQAKEHAEREKAYVKAKARRRRQDRGPREDRIFRREES
jgi:hypothetical protein